MSYPPEPSDPQNPYGYPQQQPAQPQPGAVAKSSYASWGARVGAYLIDALIIGLIPGILVGIGYAQLISHAVHTLQTCQDQDTTTCPAAVQFGPGTALLIYGGALLALAGGLWLAYREGKTGCTPGKQALHIKLVRESTGQPVGFGLAFGRRLLHVLDGLPCYIGYLWPLWDAKRQTFADKVVSTVVIKSQ